MKHETKRELFVWGALLCAFVATLTLAATLNQLVINARAYMAEVREMKELQGYPPSKFWMKWPTKDHMEAGRENPQQRLESPRELAERTLADVMEIQKIVANTAKE